MRCGSKLLLYLAFLACLCPLPFLRADVLDEQNRLFNDMLIVDYWNRRINDRLPVTFNHLLQGGYLNMPSARMGHEGEIGVGYSSVPPYRNYNLRAQLIDRLEVSGNYRVFRGIEDPILSKFGFGDLSDKGANVKLALLFAEDSDYQLPGIAIGIEDFMGTRNFTAKYIVATKVFLDHDFEVSLGYGSKRIQGLFGGFAWMPFRQSCQPYLQGLCLTAEFDAIAYKKKRFEKHPKGREKKSAINVGLKYRLWDQFDFSVGYVRGKALAWSLSTFYNFGYTKGLLPKIHDPLIYNAPVITEPLGPLRSQEAMAQDLVYAFRGQGFTVLQVALYYDVCARKTVRLRMLNTVYRSECELRMRLSNLLANLIPSDIDQVIVVLEDFGFPIQEYHFPMAFVSQYGDQQMGFEELQILSPVTEVQEPSLCLPATLFKRRLEWYNIEIYPRTNTFFGSAKGKFKYALGVNLGINGFLYDDVYYSLRFGLTALNNIEGAGIDRLNPSQLPNVRSDVVRYFRIKGLSLDEAYLQKNWNLGHGLFSRISLGYFEEEYAGLATEFLYYPVCSDWAIGIEGAVFKKRKTVGLELTNKVRQLHGFEQTFHRFTFAQYFLNFYYDWKEAKLDFQINAGKFLADDYGARFEVTRYFPSGLRLSFWYTLTNGKDNVNGHTYYDKGISFSMPLDIFYTRTERSRWGYGMSAWLRDVGVQAATGLHLYPTIREHRN